MYNKFLSMVIVFFLAAGLFAQTTMEMRLDDALAYAWQNHPKMKEAQRMILAAHGEKTQAGLWPRPEAEAMMMDGDSTKESEYRLSQKIELGGKRSARIDKAAGEIFLKETELVSRWVAIRAEIKQQFARLASARKIRELTSSISQTDADVRKLAEGMLNAGKLSQTEFYEIQKAAAESKAKAESAKAEAENAERQLYASIGMNTSEQDRKIDLTSQKDAPSVMAFDELLAIAKTNSPELKTAVTLKEIADARMRMAKAERMFDLTVGVSVKNSEDKVTGDKMNGTGGRISVDIPLFNRSQGNVEAAKNELEGSKEAYNAAELKTTGDIAAMLSDYEKWAASERSFKDTIIPEAEKNLQRSKTAFESGKISKREYLMALKESLSVQVEGAEAHYMLLFAGYEIERIVTPVLNKE